MRSLTTQQTNVLNSKARATFVKVEVMNSAGNAFNDLTSYVANGRTFNFVQQVEWSDNVDNPGADATITFHREVLYYNLSPLMAGSYLNINGTLVDLNRQIKISIADMPINTRPAASDWVQQFYGRIYQTEFGADTTLVATCADMTNELMSFWIESQFVIGSTGGTAAETVMQNIINTAISATSYTPYLSTLYSINGTGGTPFNPADTPSWSIIQGVQSDMALMTALTNINQQIGWLLRQKWNASTGSFVLTWYDPNRSNVTPAWTFAKSSILDYSTVGVHLGDIRNVIHVAFFDANNNMAPSRYVLVDNTSINLYGRQYMQLAEEATSQINTATQAALMANGALSDLSQPKLDHTVTVPLFWPAEVADLYTFKADGVHYDSDQTLGLVGWKHSIQPGKLGTTELQMRGKPSGGVRVWFDRQKHKMRRQIGVYNAAPTSDVTSGFYPNATLGQFTQS